ncbi:hypothetical protein R1sor_025927 [Riccia sorocarpa]|uniref:Uncharacterized protein n=1 Tax=Riccia sorocarpa TaxID=122646 RepID=A0ABD3GFM0_9MARC
MYVTIGLKKIVLDRWGSERQTPAAAFSHMQNAAGGPATVELKKKKKKKKKAIPDVQATVPEGVDVPSPDEVSLIPPNGIPGEVCLGIRVNVEEFKNDFTSGHRVWSSGKLNIRDNCTNNFLKRNWEKWRKQAKPSYLPRKAEVRKSFLHYALLELHGVKVDWTTVDLSQAINTVSYERRMAARRELFRMRVRMDGRLVETMDPNEMEKSHKGNRSRKRKRRLASETKNGVPSTDNSPPMETLDVPVNPSAPTNTSGVATEATGGSIVATESVVERSQKAKEKVSEASAEPDSMEDKMMKRALKISRADHY